MNSLQRCPACRARLGEVAVCSRCGTDFSITRLVQKQAAALACRAVRQLALGQVEQADSAAKTACALANSLLARAVLRTLKIREKTQQGSLPEFE